MRYSPPSQILLLAGNGGANDLGAAFRFDIASGTFTTLHNFNGADGASPASALLFHGGAAYGTTHAGGATNTGTFYKMNAKTGAVTVIHSFGNPDGRQPSGDLVYTGGAFYGAATYGGLAQHGMIFKIDAATGTESVAYTLGVSNGNGTDGFYPAVGLTLSDGNLIGSTTSGGDYGLGTMFRIALPSGITTVLHSFAGGRDQFPAAGLTRLGSKVFGVTPGNFTTSNGTVFQFNRVRFIEMTIHAFGPESDYSRTALISGGGVLYGATTYGGASGNGIVFKLSP